MFRKDAGESDSCYDGHQVTVHDLLRDLAIMECNQGPSEDRKRLIVDVSGNKLPNWWIERDHKPVNARLAAIITGSSLASLSVILKDEFHHLTMLMNHTQVQPFHRLGLISICHKLKFSS